MLERLGLALHRAVLRTERPLRPLWRLAHRAVILGATACLLRGERGSGAYLRASFGYGDERYGLSDVDMVVVLADEPPPGHACPRVRRRWARLCRVVPGLRHLVQPTVYERGELHAALSSSTVTAAGAIHLGTRPPCDEASLRFRPGLFGPLRDSRHLAGRDHRPPAVPAQGEHERRTAAWLELQRWWREAFFACAHPGGPRLPYLCVKLVAEPARIWLWLVHGEAVERRRDVLERALRRMPEEEAALTRALRLYDALPRSPAAPLAEMLADFLRLSARLGRRLEDELAPAGTTSVRLTWGDERELVLAPDARERMRALGHGEPTFLPLADWRARVWPVLPDHAIAPIPLDPTDPPALGAAARAAGDWGPYAAVRAGGLLVLPGPGLMRAVQCAPTDPVSFALLDGRESAEFPDVPGWSAGDSARRAVAEHRAWVGAERPGAAPAMREWMEAQGRTTVPRAETLAHLLTAAQAALFLESLERGAPELELTVAAVVRRLGATAADEAYAHLRAGRAGDGRVPARVVGAMRELVLGMPAYRFRSPWAGDPTGPERMRRC